jgi:hypothetical protein
MNPIDSKHASWRDWGGSTKAICSGCADSHRPLGGNSESEAQGCSHLGFERASGIVPLVTASARDGINGSRSLAGVVEEYFE